MKLRSTWQLVLVMVCAWGSASSAQRLAGEEADVRAVLAAYRAAIQSKDGAAALGAVSQGSVDFFGTVLQRALTGGKAEILKMSAPAQFLVLRTRLEFADARLETLGPAEFYVKTVNAGWTPARSVADWELGSLTFTGNRATAPLVLRGKPLPNVVYGFAKDGGKWKVDLTPLFSQVDTGVRAAVDEAGRDKTKTLLAALARVTGKPVTDSVWEPLRKPEKP